MRRMTEDEAKSYEELKAAYFKRDTQVETERQLKLNAETNLAELMKLTGAIGRNAEGEWEFRSVGRCTLLRLVDVQQECLELRAELAEVETRRNETVAACEQLRDELADVLDLKNGCGPSALTAIAAERDRLAATVERVKSAIACAALDYKGYVLNTDLRRALAEPVAEPMFKRTYGATSNQRGTTDHPACGRRHYDPHNETVLSVYPDWDRRKAQRRKS